MVDRWISLRRIAGLITLWILYSILTVAPAHAQSWVGARLGMYADREDAFIGIELLTRVLRDMYFNPNIEYIFVEGATFFTLNFDIHYDFYSTRDTSLWIGAGFAVLYFNPEGPRAADTDAGINVIFGAALVGRPITPYLQAKIVITENSEFVLAMGLRF